MGNDNELSYLAGVVAALQKQVGALYARTLLLTDGYVPYHVSDAVGLADSVIFQNGSNVGIGTTGPNSKLEVFGANVDPAIFLRTGAANKYTSIRFASTGITGGESIGLLGMSGGAGTFVPGDVADDIVLGTQGAQNLILSTNSVSRVYIKSDGSVLIGATALGATERLSVIGVAAAAGIYFNDQAPNTTTTTLYRSGNDLYWGATKLN